MKENKDDLTLFEEIAREVQSRPEKEQHDICLIIQGYLAGSASKEAKVS